LKVCKYHCYCLFQVGAASDLEQYIHRLGRTGRAGKTGEGLLILAPWENYFLKKLESTKVSITPVLSPEFSSQGNMKVNAFLCLSLSLSRKYYENM
jgi:superfamily II DNA/RNA helicase